MDCKNLGSFLSLSCVSIESFIPPYALSLCRLGRMENGASRRICTRRKKVHRGQGISAGERLVVRDLEIFV